MDDHSRYWIGIDLGTTNSVVAYCDRQEQQGSELLSAIRTLNVPQLVSEGEVRALQALPSFLYLPSEGDLSSNSYVLPWEENPAAVVGVFARDQGALVPGRQVSSAKSWLCQSAVDRHAAILPWDAQPPEPRMSPIEASASYLAYLRQAWNHTIATDSQTLFEKQAIVLTVPASFDEEARELTVEAAQRAGIINLTLLEEPTAAFYAWIASHRKQFETNLESLGLHDGDHILICDIGGGTTDFSLIRVRRNAGDCQLERTAIGEHLLLGGDNLDIALAHRVEERIGDAKLTLRQRHALQRACCAAKEQLLGDPTLERLPVRLLGSGRAIVGQMLAAELSREEIWDVLTSGFLPLTAAEEAPKREGRAGLRELGLPYAADAAITRHLAAFLANAGAAIRQSSPSAQQSQSTRMVRPDAILFNGGFCAAPIVRERIVEAISHWFRQDDSAWRPRVLGCENMNSAVATGAAYYASIRHGSGIRIKAGSARTYYVAMRAERGICGVCVLPHGTEEGTTLPLPNREFAVLANRPVSFTLYSSTVRRDAHGQIAELNPDEIHRHAPLGTLLRYGKKMRERELAVRLRANFTEMGTLELWCESLETDHRWRLQFELRANEGHAIGDVSKTAHPPVLQQELLLNISEQALNSATELLKTVFSNSSAPNAEVVPPEKLVAKLEEAVGISKDAWPIAAIRKFGDTLAQLCDGRGKSPQHEVRWLNLAGFCLRPGFGAHQDEARMSQLRKVYLSAPVFPREIPSQIELLVLLRRVAGGLSASQQHELYRRHGATINLGANKRNVRLNAQVERDTWRLLAGLEHLPAQTRAQLGHNVLAKIKKDPSDRALLWSLGRLGARIPLYGPPNCVVPPKTAAEWIETLLGSHELTPVSAFAIIQLGAYTGDHGRDIPETLRKEALYTLSSAGFSDELSWRLACFALPSKSEIERIFGESLPQGLRLVTSATCLLSVTALTAALQSDSQHNSRN